MNKVCCIFNTAAHYRKPIYKLIDQHFNCDFYIGDKVSSPMKMMDYSELSGFKKELKNIYLIGNIYWQKGALKTVFSDYKHFIITGEPHCLSTWLILLLSRLTTKKSYLWTHGWYGRETKVKKIVKKLFFGLSSHVLLYGDYARNLMIKEGYNPNKLHCIYNSLDFDHQREIREKLNKSDIFKSHFKNDYPTICYVLEVNISKISNSNIIERLGLQEKGFILLSARREENIDDDTNFFQLMNSINPLAESYNIPIIYSLHPRSKKFIEKRNFVFHALVRKIEPLSFTDYNTSDEICVCNLR